jgi:hypothetical protein
VVLTTAEIVTLLAALIGQSGAFVNLIEYLHAQGGKEPLPPQHKSALDELLTQHMPEEAAPAVRDVFAKLRSHVIASTSANPVVNAVAEQMR